jgi:hypothetical protein
MNEGQIVGNINRAFEAMREPAKDSITNCTCEEYMEIREDFAGKQPEDLGFRILNPIFPSDRRRLQIHSSV